MAASMTRWAAGQMSTPVPSPSMKGMMGSLGTRSLPSGPIVILSAMARKPRGGEAQRTNAARSQAWGRPVPLSAHGSP